MNIKKEAANAAQGLFELHNDMETLNDSYWKAIFALQDRARQDDVWRQAFDKAMLKLEPNAGSILPTPSERAVRRVASEAAGKVKSKGKFVKGVLIGAAIGYVVHETGLDKDIVHYAKTAQRRVNLWLAGEDAVPVG